MSEYKEHKVDSKLIHTPMEEICGDPNDRQPEGGIWNGEPDAPYVKRTGGNDRLPEKTLDTIGEFGKAEEKPRG